MKNQNTLLVVGGIAALIIFLKSKTAVATTTTDQTIEPVTVTPVTTNSLNQSPTDNLITDLPSVDNPFYCNLTIPMGQYDYGSYILQQANLKQTYSMDEAILAQQTGRPVSLQYDYAIKDYNREMINGSNVAVSQNIAFKIWYG